jgi:hypothetical protein
VIQYIFIVRIVDHALQFSTPPFHKFIHSKQGIFKLEVEYPKFFGWVYHKSFSSINNFKIVLLWNRETFTSTIDPKTPHCSESFLIEKDENNNENEEVENPYVPRRNQMLEKKMMKF